MRASAAGAPAEAASKRRLLVQTEPSHAASIADAVVIKDGDLYFLCQRDGSVPLESGHGLGLYFHDCRFSSGYVLTLEGARLEPLAASGTDGFRSVFQLTNPNIGSTDSGLNRERIGVRWRHVIDAEHRALHDEIVIQNYDTEPHDLSLALAFDADFRDIFTIRGLTDQRPGQMRGPRWEQDDLIFAYDGADNRRRELRIRCSERPTCKRPGQLGIDLHLEPHDVSRLIVSLEVLESEAHELRGPETELPSRALPPAEAALERSLDDWMHGFVSVRSDSRSLDKTIHRSLRDLRALRTTLDQHSFFAAGVPWFTTLFGRDSLICALQTLAFRREIAAETLRLLARMQGEHVDLRRDEEPGKILHEYRAGELARSGAIPYSPYYGTVDATPLFLIVLREYTRWTGDLELFHELRQVVDQALTWIDEYGDHDGDGYIDYCAGTGDHLINQGWKDSGGAIVDSAGQVAQAPIALVEVQGYVFLAKLAAAELFARSGCTERASKLRRDARELSDRFNTDFWMQSREFYALALQRGGRAVDVISSNPGQALWTGIIAADKAERVVRRLMSRDMYSGWGIRTLSTEERSYNPIGYHLGTVWPHDNALIAAGLRRSGFDAEACRVFSDLLQAAAHFEDQRLPELFAGYDREEYGIPVRYPVACHPQAWAAGSIPFLLQSSLGLEPNAFEKRLRVVRPCLPSPIERVELRGLRIGGAELDLRVERTRQGRMVAVVQRLSGELEVVAELDGASKRLA